MGKPRLLGVRVLKPLCKLLPKSDRASLLPSAAVLSGCPDPGGQFVRPRERSPRAAASVRLYVLQESQV